VCALRLAGAHMSENTMRKIKFRSFHSGRGMIYNVHGLWISNGESFGHILDDTHQIIMQFTGLTDKNGNEIYEGDIVHCTARMYTIENTFQIDDEKVVTFEDGPFHYDDITLGNMICSNLTDYTFEVTVKIYGNPEVININ
jgi:uncharacterized phage protein (TIGR01671 family)